MNEKPKLFGTAGIRGPFGLKVTANLVFQVSQAVAQIYPSEGIVVGHDARISSEALGQCATAAVSLSGGNVFKVGLCAFPVIANLTLDEKHTVAIYITASHNPPTDNGIKVLRNGREFTEGEQDEIEIIIGKRSNQDLLIHHAKWSEIKPQSELKNANERYIDRLTKELQLDGGGKKIIIDCANGPMSILAPSLLNNFGFSVTSINSTVDGYFPGRLAEPSPGNLGDLMDLCKKENSIGFAFDGDGDRLAVIDENGNFMELSRINALLASLVIEKHGPGKIVLSIDSIPLANSKNEKKEKWQSSFVEQLELILENSLPASEDIRIESPFDKDDGRKVSLTLYLVPGESPCKFFTRSAWHKTPAEEINRESEFSNTLIGFVE